MPTGTSNSLSFLLDEVVSSVTFESFFGEPFTMPVLYDVRTSNKRRERGASFAGIREYEVKTNNAEPSEDEIVQQFEKDFVHVSYGKQLPVERELIDDEEWGILQDMGQQLGVMAAYTMEQKAADLWNDMFAGVTYKSEDNLPICSSAHVNVDAANSQSNSLSNALNLAGLKATRLAHRKLTNYNGDKLAIRPNLLVVPLDLEDTGWELTRSVGKPETAQNELNFYNGMFNMVVWDFLSDTNAWFMCDPMRMAMNLIWYQRVALEVFGDGNLFTGTRKIGGYFRASHGVRDWRFVVGNNPS